MLYNVVLISTTCAKSLQTLFDPVYHSPAGSAIHGILEVRILGRLLCSSPRGTSWPRGRTHVSHTSAVAGGFFTTGATWEAQFLPYSKISAIRLHKSSPFWTFFAFRWVQIVLKEDKLILFKKGIYLALHSLEPFWLGQHVHLRLLDLLTVYLLSWQARDGLSTSSEVSFLWASCAV